MKEINDWVTVPEPAPINDWVTVDQPKNLQEPVSYHGRNVADMSGTSQFLTGAGNKVVDLGRGAVQALGLANEKNGGFGSQQDISESRKLTEALGKTGAGAAGNFAGDVVPFVMTGGGSTIPALVTKSAALSALAPVSGKESRIENAGIGAVSGLTGGAANKGLARAMRGFTPSKAAQALMDKGIQPTVGQGIEQGLIGKGLRKMEETSTSLPFLGAITRHARDRATTEAAHKIIAEAEDKALGVSAGGALGHEAINNLKATFTQAYDKVLAGHRIGIKPALIQDITDIIANPASFINTSERKSITNGMQGLFDKIRPDANGKYLASDIFKIESELKAQGRSMAYGDPKIQIINDLKNTLGKYRENNIPQAAGDAIKQLNAKYVNFTRLRKAAEGVGAPEGEFSPAQVYNAAVTMGKKSGQAATGTAPLQKMSGQMKNVLSDKLGESGTTPRALAAKLLAGGAEGALGYTNPAPSALIGAAMLAGSARPVQKALLGGYQIQPRLADFVSKGDIPAAALARALSINSNKGTQQ